MISSNFWKNVFSNFGFEKTTILGKTTFKIPIYEAIYMSQVMGASKKDLFEDDWRRREGYAFILVDEENILQFPKSSPSLLLKDITLNVDSFGMQINPLLSPSLKFMEKCFPEFFAHEEKYLIILDLGQTKYKSKRDVRRGLLNEIRAEKLKPTDFVFFMIPFNDVDSDYIGEHILEYLLSCYLRKKGFMVDKFSESLKGEDNRKFPDLYALKIPRIQNVLIEKGIIQHGAYFCELELRNQSNQKRDEVKEEVVIVVEVESSKKRRGAGSQGGKGQLTPSLESGYYDEGIVFAPFVEDIHSDVKSYRIGFGTMNKKEKILLERYPQNYEPEKVPEIKKMVERIVKLTLLKNLPLIQVFDLLPEVQSFYDLYYSVDGLDIEEIISSIKNT